MPLGFASRLLQKAESRYPIHNLELQAAVYGIEALDHLLRGRTFHIFTDHRPLETQTKLQSKTLNRLQEILGRHRCSINYIKGKDNQVADYLSRFAHPSQVNTTSTPVLPTTAFQDAYEKAYGISAMCSREEIIREQQQCQQSTKIIMSITGNSTEPATPRSTKYTMFNGVLRAQPKDSQVTEFVCPQDSDATTWLWHTNQSATLENTRP